MYIYIILHTSVVAMDEELKPENLQTQWLQPPRFRWLHPAAVPHSRQRRCQTETWRQLSVRETHARPWHLWVFLKEVSYL